jgi:hypothetical protein
VILADIFCNPSKLFQHQAVPIKSALNRKENMDEDDMDVLIVEGDRKRSRGPNSKDHVHNNMYVHEGKSSTNDTEEKGRNDHQHFLMAGPGGARQG